MNFDMERYTGTTEVAQHKMILAMVSRMGLTIGKDTEIRIGIKRSYDWRDGWSQDVELVIDHKKLSEASRHKLKRSVELAVPSYALGGTYQSPPLCGHLSYQFEGDELEVDITVSGAYTCKKVEGKKVVTPAPQYKLDEATKMEGMTDEEILAAHKAKIDEMRAPSERDAYECAPSK